MWRGELSEALGICQMNLGMFRGENLGIGEICMDGGDSLFGDMNWRKYSEAIASALWVEDLCG